MTHKQKLFVKHYQQHGNGSRAVIESGYRVVSKNSAGAIASQNLTKLNIVNSLISNTELFESAIVNTVKEWQQSDNTRKREIAMQNAQYGHDKIHGKAKQSVEVQTTSVTLNIDLTGTQTPITE